MSIFDPFGFLAKSLITGKLLMQNVWKPGIAWNDEVPDELYKLWQLWMS